MKVGGGVGETGFIPLILIRKAVLFLPAAAITADYSLQGRRSVRWFDKFPLAGNKIISLSDQTLA